MDEPGGVLYALCLTREEARGLLDTLFCGFSGPEERHRSALKK